MKPAHPSYPTLAAVEASLVHLLHCPMLLCWGGRDFCFNDYFYEQWQARFPDAEAHYFAEAGHYVLEDAFAPILPLVEQFLADQGE